MPQTTAVTCLWSRPVPSLRCIFTVILFLWACNQPSSAWEWSDWTFLDFGPTKSSSSLSPPLTLSQVSELRVREIKRRLAHHYGYSPEELAQMLDKKELIQALAFAEEQKRRDNEESSRRSFLMQSIVGTFVSIVAVCLWPLIAQAYEVAMINLVVYKDRKMHEANRCWELQSPVAILGVVLMGILDLLQVWLSFSVFLSWFMRSKYFFPTPNLPVRPGQFMGQEIANSSAGNYGINIGSMVLTWAMRFAHGKIESWTGKAMAAALRRQARAEKAKRKEEKRKAKVEAERARKQAMEDYRKEFMDHIENDDSELDGVD